MNEANVIQNAGAVLVEKLELFRVPTSCLTNANRAISVANAMRVRVAARNEVRDERRVTVIWVEKERSRATNDTIAATGWIAKPRVQLDFIVAVSSELLSWMRTL